MTVLFVYVTMQLYFFSNLFSWTYFIIFFHISITVVAVRISIHSVDLLLDLLWSIRLFIFSCCCQFLLDIPHRCVYSALSCIVFCFYFKQKCRWAMKCYKMQLADVKKTCVNAFQPLCFPARVVFIHCSLDVWPSFKWIQKCYFINVAISISYCIVKSECTQHCTTYGHYFSMLPSAPVCIL